MKCAVIIVVGAVFAVLILTSLICVCAGILVTMSERKIYPRDRG